MAKSDQRRVFNSLPVLVAVAFIAGGVLLSHLPLESARPKPPEGLEPPSSSVDKVEGRLWQDPFKVAQDHARTAHGKADGKDRLCTSEHCVNQITSELNSAPWDQGLDRPDKPPAVQIVTVLVRDGDAAEDYERRLRNRYAVLMALNAAGMEPDDTRHIRYFTLGPKDGWTHTAKPLIVPFEQFGREPLYREAKGPQRERRPEKLIVVWFPETGLGEDPLSGLADLVRHYMGADERGTLKGALTRRWPSLIIDVIGPSRSTMLRAMLAELARPKASKIDWRLRHLTIFSPWSTASPVLLTKGLGETEASGDPNSATQRSVITLSDMFNLVSSRFSRAGIRFVRMIGTDDLLALHLVEELKRRRIHVVPRRAGEEGAHVALISEWDTFYGKAFPLAFGSVVACSDPNRKVFNWRAYARYLSEAGNSDPYCLPANVHTYTYVSGIDGRLPDSTSEEKPADSKDARMVESVWTYSKSLEVPIGRGQLDYARRLALKLRDHYLGREGHKLQAIGVVGSDVYDKLPLLHALREAFGDITLFTTDLDARLLHHEQFEWTRNLIVASNYGLELNPKYQCRAYESARHTDGGTGKRREPSPFPPFRDNYQTSLFLACRAALGLREKMGAGGTRFREFKEEQIAGMLEHPRLFEIGRAQAVDLSVTHGEPTVQIHPARAAYPGLRVLLRRHLWLLVSLGIGLLLLWPIVCGMVPLVSRLEPRKYEEVATLGSSWKRYGVMLLCALAAALISAYVIIRDHYDAEGEPFSLTSGVSAWPGILLFLAAMLLSVFFVWCSVRMLRANEAAIVEEFKLSTKKKSDLRFIQRVCSYIGKAAGHAGTLMRKWRHLRAGARRRERVKARALWHRHMQTWLLSDRVICPLLWFCVFWVFPLSLVAAFGHPHQPSRGATCYITYATIAAFCLTSLLALLILIANNIRRRLRIINPIVDKITVWPKKRINVVRYPEMAEWLDVRFVARVTEGAGELVYFPALILLLAIAARMPYFDNWGFPALLFIVYAIPCAYILGLMASLQLAARRARAAALFRLQEQLEAIDFGSDQPPTSTATTENGQATPTTELRAEELKAKRERIERLISAIEELREGAFRPFMENPIVHALLIPSGGAGMLAVLTYLLPG